MTGEAKSGKRNCSIRDLAKYVGLSTCTVSKVLNNRAGRKIPPATQERVLAAARELNYVPNVNAQRLFRRRSGVIGLLVPAHPIAPGNVFGDSHFVDILSGMEPRLEENDFHLMLLFRNGEKRPDESYPNLFRAGTIDGLLIWGASPDCACHSELEKNGMPYLFITSRPVGAAPESVNLVGSRYRETAREVTRALAEAGCRRILYLAGPEKSSVVSEMREGVGEALAGTGIALTTRFSRYIPEEARQAAFEAMRGEAFDGILNVSRDMTPGILEAAESLGTGGDSLRMATLDCASNRPLLPYELAAGQVDDIAIGRAAIDSLTELIERKTDRVHRLFPGRVVRNPRFFPTD